MLFAYIERRWLAVLTTGEAVKAPQAELVKYCTQWQEGDGTKLAGIRGVGLPRVPVGPNLPDMLLSFGRQP